MSVMIQTENLGRYFGEIKAVDGVSFKVSRGEVLGFLGPNGAGKSTTMKLITGFLSPSFGTARVGNHDILSDSRAVRKLIGYLPENAPLYGEMAVGAFLDFVAEVRGIGSGSGSARKQAVDRVIQMVTLERVVGQRIETLSKGFKRRVGLAQALIHDPEILILDEPTDGLDPNQKHEVRELIRGMAKSKCIILSTHILEEVDEVCTRAVVIAKGKVVADDTPEALRKKAPSSGAISITFKKDPGEEALSSLRKLSGVKSLKQIQNTSGRCMVMLLPERSSSLLSTVVKEVERNSWDVADLRLEEGQLDEVFRSITS